MADELDALVDSIPMRPVPMPRSGDVMLASQAGERVLCVNDSLTIKQARERVAEFLVGELDSRFPTHADGVTITSSAMPASAASLWIRSEDDLVFALNEDLQLRDSQPHTIEQVGTVTSAPIEAVRAT